MKLHQRVINTIRIALHYTTFFAKGQANCSILRAFRHFLK